jgi:hypothetical protein
MMERHAMKTTFKLVVAACAAGAVALLAMPVAEAACMRVSAKGEGITKELAQGMAKMNLEMAVASKKAKASGKVAYKCGGPGPLLFTSCTAKQRACS